MHMLRKLESKQGWNLELTTDDGVESSCLEVITIKMRNAYLGSHITRNLETCYMFPQS